MKLDVKFAANDKVIKSNFGEIYEVSDGGYDRGYDDGYKVGEKDGFGNGYDVGLEDGYEEGYNKAEKQNYLYYANDVQNMFTNIIFPENSDIVIKFKKAPKYFGRFMTGAVNTKTVTLISEDKSNLIDFGQAFRENKSIEILDLTNFNRSFSNVSYLFLDASNIREVKGELDFSSCTAFTIWANGANKLEEIRVKPNTIKISISFNLCPKLTHDSLMSIINGLAVVETTQTLTLGTTNLNKLTDEEKAIATEKGWSLA